MIDINLHGVTVAETQAVNSLNGRIRLSIDDSMTPPVTIFCKSQDSARAIGEAFIALADEMEAAKERVA